MLKKSRLIASLLLVVFVGGGAYWRMSAADCCHIEIQRSFHRGLIFDVYRSDDDLILETTFYKSVYYTSGDVAQQMKHILSATEKTEFEMLLAKMQRDLAARSADGLRDGSEWRIRFGGPFARSHTYRSPDYLGPAAVWEIGRFLWRIAKVDEPAKNLY